MKTIEEKRNEAIARQTVYDALSPEARLAWLDERLGKGVGAKRQRARITTQMVMAQVKTFPKRGKKG